MSWDRDKERKAGKAMSIGNSVFGLFFAIAWCVIAVSMGAGFMLIFGLPFVGMMGYRLYVLLQVAKKEPGKGKETEPWDRPDSPPQALAGNSVPAAANGFCPYCGSAVQTDFDFCPKCGRRLK